MQNTRIYFLVWYKVRVDVFCAKLYDALLTQLIVVPCLLACKQGIGCYDYERFQQGAYNTHWPLQLHLLVIYYKPYLSNLDASEEPANLFL